jgi:hypothetical protein
VLCGAGAGEASALLVTGRDQVEVALGQQVEEAEGEISGHAEHMLYAMRA